MKKFLSILIAISLVITIIPAAFAADGDVATEQKLFSVDIASHAKGLLISTQKGDVVDTEYRKVGESETQYYINSTYYSDYNGRTWKLFDISNDVLVANGTTSNFALRNDTSANGDYFRVLCNNGYLNLNLNVALTLKATHTGFYIPELKFYNGSKATAKLDWYITDADAYTGTVDYTDTLKGYKNPENNILSVTSMTENTETREAEKLIYTQSGKELVSAFVGGKQGYRFYDITLTEVQGAKLHISADKTDLDTTTNKTATVTSTVEGTNLENPKEVAGGFVKYYSDNPAAATVDEKTGVITAVAPGEANITAKSSDGVINSVETITITVTAPEPEDEVAKETVSFAQTTNIDGFKDIAVTTVNRGDLVALAAHKGIDGYKFVGWKRGADTSDKNAWVDITGDTYSVWTNTYLTAVYEPVTAEGEKAVAFWNQNGAYIGKMDEATYNKQETLFTPKLTGFGTFIGWLTDGNAPFTAKQTLAAGTTNAVAKYEASAISDVTFNGSAIAGADKYNADITLLATSDATTCWKRDGETIAYGKTYKFNVWDATNITEGTEEITDKVPVAILDYSANHKAYMLEYDAGDYEIVEAGIIFGKDTADIKTYTSQRKEKHNQFTVPEEGALEATGYIIYTLDNGVSYKTKYVSVKTEE